MVNFPPLAPASNWFSLFLKALASGSTEEAAIIEANICLPSSKDFGRFRLEDKHGRILTLSVAIEGGGRQLRTIDKIPKLELSEHGDWRKIHSGAIESCLGSKPYYRHLEGEIIRIFDDKSLQSLRDFNMAIFRTLKTFLLGNIREQQLPELLSNPLLRERGKEIGMKINPDVSLLQTISEHGRETLLGIL